MSSLKQICDSEHNHRGESIIGRGIVKNKRERPEKLKFCSILEGSNAVVTIHPSSANVPFKGEKKVQQSQFYFVSPHILLFHFEPCLSFFLIVRYIFVLYIKVVCPLSLPSLCKFLDVIQDHLPGSNTSSLLIGCDLQCQQAGV